MVDKIVCGDARDYSFSADLILTDPPFDMPGAELSAILENYHAPHLVLITTMTQLLDFMSCGGWHFNFDFVFDGVAPKKAKSARQPNYTHSTGVYLTRPGVQTAFNRHLRARSDTFEHNGYWPTIFRAPRGRMREYGQAKNEAAVTDLLGSFEIESVIDPFAGSGTTVLAAIELSLDFIAVEKDLERARAIREKIRFFSYKIECVGFDDA